MKSNNGWIITLLLSLAIAGVLSIWFLHPFTKKTSIPEQKNLSQTDTALPTTPALQNIPPDASVTPPAISVTPPPAAPSASNEKEPTPSFSKPSVAENENTQKTEQEISSAPKSFKTLKKRNEKKINHFTPSYIKLKNQSLPVILEPTATKTPAEFQEVTRKNTEPFQCWVATFARNKTHPESCTEQRNLLDLNTKDINWNNVCVRIKNQAVPFEIADRTKGKIIIHSGFPCNTLITVRFCEKHSKCLESCRSKENDAFLSSLGAESEFTVDAREAISSEEGKLHNEIKKMNQLMKVMEKTEPLSSNWNKLSQKKGCQ